MKDERKTKKELIDELKKLRRKVTRLEKHDTTSKKTALKSHKKSQDKFRLIFENAPVGITQFDPDGVVVDCNNALAKMLGSTRKKIIGFDFKRRLDDTLHKRIFKEALAGNPGIYEGEYKSVTGTKTIMMKTVYSPFISGNGYLSGVIAITEDITKQKETEHSLKESEERYRTSIEHSNDGFAFSNERKLLFCNQRFLNIFGYESLEEVEGKPISLFVHPEDRHTVDDIHQKRGGGEAVPSRYEFKGIRKDGEPVFIEISATITHYQDTIVNLAFLRDITDRKIKDEALRAKEAHQSLVLRSLPMAFYVAQPFNTYGGTWVSDQIDKIAGFTSEQFIKDINLWSSRLHDEDRLRVLDEFKRITENGSLQIEYRWQTADGSYKWLLDSATLSRDEDGNPKEIIGTWLDITERKKAEQELEFSKKYLQSIIDNEPECVKLIDQDCTVIEMNPAGLAMCEADDPDKVIGQNVAHLVNPEFREEFKEFTKKVCNGKAGSLTFKITGLKGTPRWLESHSVPFDDKEREKPLALSVTRDITERMKTEEALMHSRERFRVLVESTSDWIWEIDENGVYAYTSPQVTSILGYEPGDVVGKTPFSLMPEDEAKKMSSVFGDILKNKDVFSMLENINIHKNGTRVVLETSGVPIFDNDGTFKGYRGVDRDITKRNKAETALKESEKRFRNLFENSPISLWLEDLSEIKKYIEELKGEGVSNFESYFDHNPDAVARCASMIEILDVNNATVSLFKAKNKEDFIKNVHKTFYGGSPDAFKNSLVAITTGKTELENESATLTLQGHKIFNTIKWSTVPGYEETYGRVLVSITDITEQKLVEEMLRQREQTYRTLIESTSALAWEFHLGTMKFTYVSPQADILTGYPPDEWTDFDFWANMIIPEDREWAPNYCVTETGEGRDHEFEYRIKTAGGNTVWLREIVTVIKENDKPVKLRGFMFDVTDRKNMEEEVRKAKNLESLGILAGGIAHDFNNLLTSILGNISLARSPGSPGDKISERLTPAESACLRAKDLTRQLLTFSKGGTPIKKITSMKDIIMDAVSFSLSGSNIKCTYDIDNDLQPVEVDEGQMSQVIHNLIINAREAMPEGGSIAINALNTTVASENHLPLREGKYVRVSFKDQGTGIAKENISRVFDPYFTTKEMGVQKGMGLGLTICYSIIKSHDGLMTVDSVMGEGTTFHIYLPVSEKDVQIEGPLEIPEIKDITGSGNILFMDDEPILRDVVCQMLEELGYDVKVAANGKETLEMYKEAKRSGQEFDAVILDLTIPGEVGGAETIKELKAIDPDVKAVVSSGYAEDPVVSGFQDYGFKGAMIKPYKMEEIGTVLKDILQINS